MRNELTIVSIYVVVAWYGLSTTMYEILPDARVQHWFLMRSWKPIIFILTSYLAIVFFGPFAMRNRKPLQLRPLLLAYNAFQVILCSYIFKEFVVTAWLSGYRLTCQSYDPAPTQLPSRMAAACWWFFFSKLVDTFDTIFFVLRRKNNQITFLHVYHHFSMIMNWWLAAKHLPGGQIYFQCTVNSFVHVVMYTYYFLSACGPSMQKYLWWKRYLTQLQLIQFLAIVTHTVTGMIYTSTCDFPFVVNWYIIVYCITLISLFTNFYVNEYKTNAAKVKAQANGNGQVRKGLNGLCMPLYESDHIQAKKEAVNGHVTGASNNHTNGHTNGHSSGYSNGHSNGYANGTHHRK